MDFTSPPAVIEALETRLRHGIFGYAQPHDGIKDAVHTYLLRRHAVSIPDEKIVHLGGLVPALSLAGRAFGTRGDALMTCTPVYPPFLDVAKDAGMTTIRVDHCLDDSGTWRFDWGAMESQVPEKTKVFLLRNPQNPLGRSFNQAEITRVAEFCHRHKLVLLSDEIHCDLVLDDEETPFFSTLKLPAELQQNLITLLSPSKTYNIAGLGYAYAVIPNDHLQRKFKRARGHTLPEINCLAYYAAEAAYRDGV